MVKGYLWVIVRGGDLEDKDREDAAEKHEAANARFGFSAALCVRRPPLLPDVRLPNFFGDMLIRTLCRPPFCSSKEIGPERFPPAVGNTDRTKDRFRSRVALAKRDASGR